MKKVLVLGIVGVAFYFLSKPKELELSPLAKKPAAVTLSTITLPDLNFKIPDFSWENTEEPKTAEKAEAAREREDYFHRLLDEKPDSAEAHADYAQFLAFERRADEARREIAEAVRLAPQNKAFQVYRKQIEDWAREKGIPPLLGLPLEKFGDLKVDTPTEEGYSKEEQESQRKDLVARYGETTVYYPSERELDRLGIAADYNVHQLPDAAEEAYQKVIEDFPDSPLARGKYAHFLLLNRNRPLEAQDLVNDAVAQFPQDRYLNVMRDVFLEEQQRSPASTPEATLSIDISYRLMLLAIE